MNRVGRRLPLTRGDCIDGQRPCPFVECRHHLDIEKRGRAVGGGPTCSLDVADLGEHTLAEVGDILGVTRERVRQIEEEALGSVVPIGLARGDSSFFAHAAGPTFGEALEPGEALTIDDSERERQRARRAARHARARRAAAC